MQPVFHTRQLTYSILKSFVKPYCCTNSRSFAKMSAWEIHQYGTYKEFTLNSSRKTPVIKSPDELIVRVNASSVNPIDLKVLGGYGRTLLNVLRKRSGVTEFPMVLGRDFSGTVVETGQGVKDFKPGDEVFGAVPPSKDGMFQQYGLVSTEEVCRKPKNLTHLEAASIPYVAGTVWSAFLKMGFKKPKDVKGKRMLILAASGGVGTFTIQLCKAWEMDVTVTCGPDAADLVTSLGADTWVNYRAEDAWEQLGKLPKFDMILDPVGGETTKKASKLLSSRSGGLATLVNPMLHNVDDWGLAAGMAKNLIEMGAEAVKGFFNGGGVKWSVFSARRECLEEVLKLTEEGKIKAVIHEKFSFQDVPQAFKRCEEGHLRGKLVVEVEP